MELEKIIEKLEYYNRWRRGEEIPQPNTKEIGIAIDLAINKLKTLLK